VFFAIKETLTGFMALKRALKEDGLFRIVRILRIFSRRACDRLRLAATEASGFHHSLAITAETRVTWSWADMLAARQEITTCLSATLSILVVCFSTKLL
jgi:hypothetical protein